MWNPSCRPRRWQAGGDGEQGLLASKLAESAFSPPDGDPLYCEAAAAAAIPIAASSSGRRDR